MTSGIAPQACVAKLAGREHKACHITVVSQCRQGFFLQRGATIGSGARCARDVAQT